jgi:hypothetical protein
VRGRLANDSQVNILATQKKGQARKPGQKEIVLPKETCSQAARFNGNRRTGLILGAASVSTLKVGEISIGSLVRLLKY